LAGSERSESILLPRSPSIARTRRFESTMCAVAVSTQGLMPKRAAWDEAEVERSTFWRRPKIVAAVSEATTAPEI